MRYRYRRAVLIVIYGLALSYPVRAFSDEAVWRATDPYSYYDGSLEVRARLSVQDLIGVQRSSVTSIRVKQGTDSTLFKDPETFPRLQEVVLDGWDEATLATLAHNYPQISALSLMGSSPLSEVQFEQLRDFHRLKFLDVAVPIEDASWMSCLPVSLSRLTLKNTNAAGRSYTNVVRLPNLRELRIFDDVVEPDILLCMHAPRLLNLYLNDVDVKVGGMQGLKNFSHLAWLNLDRSRMHSDALDAIELSRSIRKVWLRSAKVAEDESENIQRLQRTRRITVVR